MKGDLYVYIRVRVTAWCATRLTIVHLPDDSDLPDVSLEIMHAWLRSWYTQKLFAAGPETV